MRVLRIMVALGGYAASLYFGINIGVSAAGSPGGKGLLSIFLVVIGLTVTGLVSRAIANAEHTYKMKNDPYYRLAYTVAERIYRR